MHTTDDGAPYYFKWREFQFGFGYISRISSTITEYAVVMCALPMLEYNRFSVFGCLWTKWFIPLCNMTGMNSASCVITIQTYAYDKFNFFVHPNQLFLAIE